MIFNTAWFLLFCALLFPIYLVAVPSRVRPLALLAMSVLFHAHFAGAAGMAPVIAIALSTFVIGILIDREREGSAIRRVLFLLGISVPIGMLCFYKYTGLIYSSLLVSAEANSFVTISIPLAISFFTFEFVHYLTDVYRGEKAVRSPLHFALFTVFFPSLVSGPIKRFEDFIPQIARPIPRPRAYDLMLGTRQVLVGFAKKLLVADNAALAIGILEAKPDPTSFSVSLLMGLLSVRILFDFSGYSDIAIGLGRIVGIRLPANFNYPYAALSIADFWRRWHISLSSWIRDYIYIPLGGGRHGVIRKSCNVLLAMFICGMWHGPDWHFGVWGLYHGFGLGINTWWQKRAGLDSLRITRPYKFGALVMTNIFVAFGWLLFFYPLSRVWVLTRVLLGLE